MDIYTEEINILEEKYGKYMNLIYIYIYIYIYMDRVLNLEYCTKRRFVFHAINLYLWG